VQDTVNSKRIESIRTRLGHRFAPTVLDVIDDSHLHANHAGARSGKGHFRVRIVAPAFVGLTPLERHRLVYESLAELMAHDIHALSIEALAPSELTSPPVATTTTTKRHP
jgi:BolA protein